VFAVRRREKKRDMLVGRGRWRVAHRKEEKRREEFLWARTMAWRPMVWVTSNVELYSRFPGPHGGERST